VQPYSRGGPNIEGAEFNIPEGQSWGRPSPENIHGTHVVVSVSFFAVEAGADLGETSHNSFCNMNFSLTRALSLPNGVMIWE
jgi:hypothetical protein